MPVQCPDCLSENADNANFCNQCGGRLRQMRNGDQTQRFLRDRRFLVMVSFLFGLVVAASLVLLFFDQQSINLEPASTLPEEKIVSRQEMTPSPPKNTQPLQKTMPVTAPAAGPDKEKEAATVETVPVPDNGYVTVVDSWGSVAAEVPSVVVDSGWIALPTRAVVGGGNWLFKSSAGRQGNFAGGLWQQGDDVGLWQLENGESFKGAPLAAWDTKEELTWVPLDGAIPQTGVAVSGIEIQGFFLHVALPESFRGPALLMQDDKVVGWSFGEVLPGAYLWNGALDTVFAYESSVADFYNQTFAGGREEQFSQALNLDERTPAVTRLAAFAAAFALPPKLLEEDTPARLRKAEILPYLRYLAGQIDNRKEAGETARLFPASVLLEIGDPQFGAAIARLAADGFGDQYAIDLLSEIIAYFQKFPAARTAELLALHLNLYRDFISSCLKEKQLPQARKIYEEASRLYADDAGLYLLGVELAIAGEDWRTAERLLNARKYPPQLLEKEKLLRASIAVQKAREGKIVIDFNPALRVIPTRALLAGVLQQKFVIDTGSSFVTIPSDTARQLGLQVTTANPQQIVFTAAGTFTAPEVVIPSIEMGGWVVENVRALVLDIPNHREMGLLGLNYLNRFQMDLDTQNGILLLSPK